MTPATAKREEWLRKRQTQWIRERAIGNDTENPKIAITPLSVRDDGIAVQTYKR